MKCNVCPIKKACDEFYKMDDYPFCAAAALMDGIKNFCVNIKPVMLKVKNGEKLTNSERDQILQFYLEVVNMAACEN